MRRRIVVPAALMAAGVWVVARRRHAARTAARPPRDPRRAEAETLATWTWPETGTGRATRTDRRLWTPPAWEGEPREAPWGTAPAPSPVEPVPAPPDDGADEELEEALFAAGLLEQVAATLEAPSPDAAAEDLPAWDPAPAEDALVWEPPAVEEILDSGPFAFGGWAPLPGATSVTGISFTRRLAEAPAAARIRLDVRSARNVPDGGLVVLADPGFAPDREGFALMVAAESQGSFMASGRWELLRPGTAG